jgi:hypothetical protein
MSAMVMANMSPMAIATVVDVVGAESPNVLSSDSWIGAGSRILFGRFARSGQLDGSACAVIAMIVTSGDMCDATVSSSTVLPENDTNKTTSPYIILVCTSDILLKMSYRPNIAKVAMQRFTRM